MREITCGIVGNRFPFRRDRFCVALFIALGLLVAHPRLAHAEGSASAEAKPAAPLPFEQNEPATPLASPLDVENYLTQQPRVVLREVKFQPSAHGAPQLITPLMPQPPTAIPKPPTADEQIDPCGGIVEKPLNQLGINIALPAGEVPTDHGSVCLASQSTAAVRSRPVYYYQWDATGLCHRPLYFEEINLERYGYGCGCCLQPLASAAHFFGTVPALPYCMAAECPHECVYTLGHYRPGSCPPWRCHWPPLDPLAAASEGGVWTGMIFLIP